MICFISGPMINNLNQEKRQWKLNHYRKCENTDKVHTAWNEAFHTSPPSRQIIHNIKNKLDKTGSGNNAPKPDVLRRL